MPSNDTILILRLKAVFFYLTQNFWRKIQELGLKTKYQNDPSFSLQTRMIPAFAFATPTDIPDLALYFESTYIRRHMPNCSVVIPSTFSLDMWDYHMMVHQGLPRTTNAVEGWHRSFSAHISCHHPSIWTFLNVLKKEEGLVEV